MHRVGTVLDAVQNNGASKSGLGIVCMHTRAFAYNIYIFCWLTAENDLNYRCAYNSQSIIYLIREGFHSSEV